MSLALRLKPLRLRFQPFLHQVTIKDPIPIPSTLIRAKQAFGSPREGAGVLASFVVRG